MHFADVAGGTEQERKWLAIARSIRNAESLWKSSCEQKAVWFEAELLKGIACEVSVARCLCRRHWCHALFRVLVHLGPPMLCSRLRLRVAVNLRHHATKRQKRNRQPRSAIFAGLATQDSYTLTRYAAQPANERKKGPYAAQAKLNGS
jgi:hypothetical protein